MFVIPDGVKALSLDIWKTLVGSNPNMTLPRNELVFGFMGVLDYDREILTEVYKRGNKLLEKQAEITGYDTGMLERIEFVLNELGITGKPLPIDQEIVELQKQIGALRILPDLIAPLTEPDLVETLRSFKDHGLLLGTLSNTGMGDCHSMIPMLDHYGFDDDLLDVRLFSCEDGRAKPNPGLFQHMADEFGVEPYEVLHIGDNANADYHGATEAGMQALLYAPKGSNLPHITSFKELTKHTEKLCSR
jgi:FMN phosphatase YigB (HAD superfamily)